MARGRLALLCLCHFAVDFACAFFLLRCLRHGADWRMGLLLYNFCAFALQMPIGLWADRAGREGLFTAAGCLLTAVGGFLPGLWAAVGLGVGNALFHVGGGTEVLYASRDAAPLGLFVAPGAVGIAAGLSAAVEALPVTALLIGLGLCTVRTAPPVRRVPEQLSLPAGKDVSPLLLSASACFFVVVLRSWVGMGADLPWKAGALAVAAAAAAAVGKAAGGLLSRRFPLSAVSGGSLAGAALLFWFSDGWGPGMGAIVLFNMTMPVTLWVLSRRLPCLRGFSFGLLTFALFLGFLPVYFGAPALKGPVLAGMSAVSLLMLLPVVGKEAKP